MSARLHYLLLTLLLTGCSGLSKTVPVATMVKCPVVKPDIECRDWPVKKNETVESLVVAYLDGRVAHKSCKLAVEAWEAAWDDC